MNKKQKKLFTALSMDGIVLTIMRMAVAQCILRLTPLMNAMILHFSGIEMMIM